MYIYIYIYGTISEASRRSFDVAMELNSWMPSTVYKRRCDFNGLISMVKLGKLT